jgi:hypothetical protein
MKYYRYLSSSKIEMLFPQVPHRLRETVSAEVGFNFGVLSGSLGSQTNRFDAVVTRLTAIERHLEDIGVIGDIRQPKEWFKGTIKAKTARLWTQGGAVFFIGSSRDVLIALGGSKHNLLGEASTSGGPAVSDLAPMLRALEEMVSSELSERSRLLLTTPTVDGWSWPELVQSVANHCHAPEEQISFVARILAQDTSDKALILATPLYVAAA